MRHVFCEDEEAVWAGPALPHAHNALSNRRKLNSKGKGKRGGKAVKGTPSKKIARTRPTPTPPKDKKAPKELSEAAKEKKRVHSRAWHGAFSAAKKAGKTDEDAKARYVMQLFVVAFARISHISLLALRVYVIICPRRALSCAHRQRAMKTSSNI